MKNREYRVLVAMAMTASLVMGSLGAVPATAYAKDAQTKTESTAEAGAKVENTTKSTAKSDSKALKDETVYAKIDGSGTVKNVIVSDELKNVNGESQIEDVSSLDDIENVKGDEEFKQTADQLKWSLEGKDICYQGTTDKELPVGVKITYELDGKEISAAELEGKSGHLKVCYQYDNATGEDGAYTPFLMVTGLVLDGDKYTNVQVTNGKVVSDGSRSIVIGMGLPKLQEELGTDALDIPDSFEFEADVTDYETLEGITIATNEVFNEADTDKFDSLSDLQSSMEQLQSASRQLVSGSGELAAGLDTLLSSSGTMADGIHRLAAGSTTLNQGETALTKGTAAISENLKTASWSVNGLLLPGAVELDQGVDRFQATLQAQVPTLLGSLQDMESGLTQIKTGTSTVSAMISTGITTEDGTKLPALKTMADTAASGSAALAGTLAQKAQDQNTGIKAVDSVVTAGSTTEVQNQLTALLQTEGLTDEQKQTIQNAIASLQAADAKAAQTAATVEQQLAATAISQKDVQSAEETATAAGTTSQVLNTLETVAANTDNGVTSAIQQTQQTSAKITDEKTGLIAQLNGGIKQLKAGTTQIRAGLEGEKGLAVGLSALAAGAEEAAAGTATAASGASELNSGLVTLENGTGTLISGVEQLDAGAKTLNEGMIQFDEEGIEKLVSVFDGDINGLLDKLNEMMDASKAYKNFSGISDQMDGKVKFVFVTE